MLIVLGVSMAYPERFKPGPPTVIWYVLWGAGALALAAALAMNVSSRCADADRRAGPGMTARLVRGYLLLR